MDKQQVDVIGAQLTERFVDAVGCLFLSGIGNPDFGREKKFITGHAAFCDGITHTLFVIISLRRVYQPITRVDGIEYATLALFGRYLKYTIS